MNGDHHAHLSRILSQTTNEIVAKYARGQAEHGGNLWQKPGMLTHLKEETYDLVVYLETLEEQLQRVLAALDANNQEVAIDLLRALLGPTGE